jgi:hypothetical protein
MIARTGFKRQRQGKSNQHHEVDQAPNQLFPFPRLAQLKFQKPISALPASPAQIS